MTELSARPRRIVVLHAGGLGDLVLAESLFAGLRDREPEARVDLVCRDEVAAVASLYRRPPDAIIGFPFDPYRWTEPNDLIAQSIRSLAGRIDGPVDVLIAAELRTTPLSDVLAAVSGCSDVLISDGSRTAHTWTVQILLEALGVSAHPRIKRLAAVPNEHELDRYARLAGAQRRLPDFRAHDVPAGKRKRLLVLPFGSSPFRSWPDERMVTAATRIAQRHRLSLELVGSTDQREALAALARQFTLDVAIRTGAPADLPAIAQALNTAAGYVGVDTGLAHLAAAYGIPGVTIYGGGTWPAYAPWADCAAGVVSPIPCFGCGWNCAFGRAFCVEGVTVEPVVEAFDAAYDRSRLGPFTVVLDAYSARERAIMESAATQYHVAQIDRSARFAVIMRVRNILRRYAARARNKRRRTETSLAQLSASAREAVRALSFKKSGE